MLSARKQLIGGNLKLQNIHSAGRFIYLFLRDDNGKQIIEKVDDFYPYYYELYTPDLGDKKLYNTFDGKKVYKCTAIKPSDVKKFASHESYESDISYPKRFLIDRVDVIEKSPTKICMFDIEIDSPDEFPNPVEAKYPVSMIYAYNNHTKKLCYWGLDGYEGTTKSKENQLLTAFCDWVKRNKFDILSAWNFLGFDWPYLFNRTKKVMGIELSEYISPIGKSRFTRSDYTLPAGISIMCLMEMYAKLTLNRKQSYALDFISHNDLGREEWGSHDFSNYAATKAKCKEDVVKLIELDKKFNIFGQYDEVRRKAKVLWEDLPQMTMYEGGRKSIISNNSKPVDQILLEVARNNNVVLPRKPLPQSYIEQNKYLKEQLDKTTNPEKRQEIIRRIKDGAFRKVYQKGRFKNITAMDLGCYSDDTEILTEDGWRKYNEIKVGDKVFAFNTESNQLKIEPILYIHQRYVENHDMRHFEGLVSDQLLSLNHKMLWKKSHDNNYNNFREDESEWEICYARDYTCSHHVVPLAGNFVRDRDYPISDDLIRVHAWIITEGWMSNNKYYRNGNCLPRYAFSQTNKNPDFVKKIDESFRNLGWRVSRRVRQRVQPTGKKYIEYNWYLIGEYSTYINLENNYKVIPLWMLKNLSTRQLTILYQTLMYGDGIHNQFRDRCDYYAINKLARDRFQYLMCLLGCSTYSNNRKEVTVRRQKYTQFKSSNVKYVKYTGVIWCPTVPSGFVMVRRKGKTFISGNSAYPNAIQDFCLDIANLSSTPTYNAVKVECTYRETGELRDVYYYKQNPNAILPTAARYLIEYKEDIKKERNKFHPESEEYKTLDISYKASKSLVNSLFGVCGLSSFRLFNKDIFNSITFLVRDLLHFVIDETQGSKLIANLAEYTDLIDDLESYYSIPVYFDTDCCYLDSNIPKIDEFINCIAQKWAQVKYGKEGTSIRFDYEGIFKPVFINELCHYCGHLDTGKGVEHKVKGMATKRSNTNKFVKKTVKQVLDMIIELNESGEFKYEEDDIIEYLLSALKDVREKDIVDFAFPAKLSRKIENYDKKEEIYVRALKNSQEFGMKIPKIGEIFYWIHTKPYAFDEYTVDEYYRMVPGKRAGTTKQEKVKTTELNKMTTDEKAQLKVITRTKKKAKDVIAFTRDNVDKMLKEKEIDWDLMIRKNIIEKVNGYFESLGWDVKKLEVLI